MVRRRRTLPSLVAGSLGRNPAGCARERSAGWRAMLNVVHGAETCQYQTRSRHTRNSSHSHTRALLMSRNGWRARSIKGPARSPTAD
eukprot:15466852-Alexandrium_andersonii.AAC.1